jgi:hypothetical protein
MRGRQTMAEIDWLRVTWNGEVGSIVKIQFQMWLIYCNARKGITDFTKFCASLFSNFTINQSGPKD